MCPIAAASLLGDDFSPADVSRFPRDWRAARAERPGSDHGRRRPGAEHAGVGQRDARVSVLAVAAGSASRETERGYPHVADKIQQGGPIEAEEVYARASRVAVAQGMPTTHPGDALFNLITFSRTWIRPWAFYAIEDLQTRAELLALFPDGCYVAFAGETYCESRNESMDDHWRVMHALPGDGQNRPSVGDSLIQVQERYNTLSNIQAETYEYGIPPIYADPQVLDFDALANQTAEPAAHYPARARPGSRWRRDFFSRRRRKFRRTCCGISRIWWAGRAISYRIVSRGVWRRNMET